MALKVKAVEKKGGSKRLSLEKNQILFGFLVAYLYLCSRNQLIFLNHLKQ